LRRVTAVNASGGQVVVQTQAATLEDAIQQGKVYVSQRLSPAGMQAQELAPEVTLRPSSVVSPQAAFYIEMKDVAIYNRHYHDLPIRSLAATTCSCFLLLTWPILGPKSNRDNV
jgi:hypothetical protein